VFTFDWLKLGVNKVNMLALNFLLHVDTDNRMISRSIFKSEGSDSPPPFTTDTVPLELNKQIKKEIELKAELLQLLMALLPLTDDVSGGKLTQNVIENFNRLLEALGESLYMVLFKDDLHVHLHNFLMKSGEKLVRIELKFVGEEGPR
jgi:hypothetical protein